MNKLSSLGGGTWNQESNEKLFSSESAPSLLVKKECKLKKNPFPVDREGQYAMLTKDNTWQQMGLNESALERPVNRKDILHLKKQLDRAIHTSQRDIHQTRRQGSGLIAEARMEQDVVAVKENSRVLLHSVKGNTDEQRYHTIHATLSASCFEQKWTDIVFGQAVQQLMISYLDQGRLLENIRNHLATSFAMMSTCLSMTLEDLEISLHELNDYKQRAEDLELGRLTLEADLNKKFQLELIGRDESAQLKYDEYEFEIKKLTASQKRMSETLGSLNVIYKKMRKDVDVTRSMDMGDACQKLENKLVAAFQELHELRPLRVKTEELTNKTEKQKDEIEELNSRILMLEEELEKKDVMLTDVLQQYSGYVNKQEIESEVSQPPPESPSEYSDNESSNNEEQNTEGELKPETKKKKKVGKKKKVCDNLIVGKKILTASGGVTVPEIGHESFQPVIPAGDTIRQGMGDSVLCPRCNLTLDESSKQEAEEQALKRLSCSGYRMLLPNLMGYRPEKPRSWTLRCIRSIIRAKRRADFSADRMSRPRMRFPEFVYGWFAPSDSRLEQLELTEGRDAVLIAKAQADENRWALYYSLKSLLGELPEAKLFYTFLDEKYGEDDFAFYIHCLTVLEAVTNETDRNSCFSWGEFCDAGFYDQIINLEEELGGELETVNDFLFIEIRHAAETVKRVMAHAPSDKRTLKALTDGAVDEEIRITPTTGQRIIDINVCLRVLMQEYRDEQAQRRASVRMMFGAAGAGDQACNKSVDLNQMRSIVSSLNPRATVADAVTLYRDGFEAGGGKVTLNSFLKVAASSHFFTKSLKLPVHFGTESASNMDASQCTKLGENVRQHMALLRPLIMYYKSTLDPPQVRELERLTFDVDDELDRGGVVLDGRRAICAIRRVLYFLLGERNSKREMYGEQERDGDATLLNANREMECIMDVLRDFAKDSKRLIIHQVQEKNCASLIQKKWRLRQEETPGIPFDMRKVLSLNFQAEIVTQEKGEEGSELKKKRIPRVVIEPLDFVLSFIEQIYRYKISVDQSISLEDAVYYSALSQFGVQAIAERRIHDFFVNVHHHASSNLRVRIFARFTGVRTSSLQKPKPKNALDPMNDSNVIDGEQIGTGLSSDWCHDTMKKVLPQELQNKHAVNAYLTALEILFENEVLFPAYDINGVSWVSLESAINCIKTLFSGAVKSDKHAICGIHPLKRVKEECMSRIERLEIDRGKVNFDSVLMIALQGWNSERIYRNRKLTEDLNPADAIVSLDGFSSQCVPVLHGQLSSHEAIEQYKMFMSASEPRAALAIAPIVKELHRKNLVSWSPKNPSPKLLPPDTYSQWKLLVYFWKPISSTIHDTINALTVKFQTSVNSDQEQIRNQLLKRTSNSLTAFSEAYQEALKTEERSILMMDNLWSLVRVFLSDIQQVRVEIGEGNVPLVDSHDAKNEIFTVKKKKLVTRNKQHIKIK